MLLKDKEMQTYELVYTLAKMNIPTTNNLEWADHNVVCDEDGEKVTVEILTIDDIGFRKIIILVATRPTAKSAYEITLSPNKIVNLALTDGSTLPVDFDVPIKVSHEAFINADDDRSKFLAYVELLRTYNIRGKTAYESMIKLCQVAPELSNHLKDLQFLRSKFTIRKESISDALLIRANMALNKQVTKFYDIPNPNLNFMAELKIGKGPDTKDSVVINDVAICKLVGNDYVVDFSNLPSNTYIMDRVGENFRIA